MSNTTEYLKLFESIEKNDTAYLMIISRSKFYIENAYNSTIILSINAGLVRQGMTSDPMPNLSLT
jgi:hypothetical protein